MVRKLKDLGRDDAVYCSSLKENLAFRKLLVREGFTWDNERSYNELGYNSSETAKDVTYFVKEGVCSINTKGSCHRNGNMYKASEFLESIKIYELW